jgi:phospholipid/cholesterol/gamma-HCH transport system permease protein
MAEPGTGPSVSDTAAPWYDNLRASIAGLGKSTVHAIEDLGHVGSLFVESVYYLVFGPRQGQPVRLAHVMEQMRQIGVDALPIVCLLSMVIGMSLAINGIAQLKMFGAESKIVIGVAIGVTREFGPLITGIVVAGRTASSLAARIGSMVVSQEVDALRVIGVEPARYLVAPALLGALLMMPVLIVASDSFAILGGALFAMGPVEISLSGYFSQSLAALETWDVVQSLIKGWVFGALVVLIGVSTGFSVEGGAEGVGRATTRAVVVSICAILVADMIFSFFLNR